MPKATLSPPNAILFVLDPTNEQAIVPKYVSHELVATTASCLSVGTQADVDGSTEVWLNVDGVVPSGLKPVFSGVLATPGGKLAIVTSAFVRVLELDVPDKAVEVQIWVDDMRNPGQVAVNARSTDVAP